MSSSSSKEAQANALAARKQQELQATYSNYKQTLQNLASKIGEVEQDAEEHRLVLETLDPLEADRKCFRLINGVLVELTVGTVAPSLKTQKEGLAKILENLVAEYKKKEAEMDTWKQKNNIQVVQQ